MEALVEAIKLAENIIFRGGGWLKLYDHKGGATHEPIILPSNSTSVIEKSFYPPDTNLCRNTYMKMRGRHNKYFVCLYIFVNMPTNVRVPIELSTSNNDHSQIHIKA